jgi:hypothetical protein
VSAVVMLVTVATRSRDARPARSSNIALAVLAAGVIGASTSMLPVNFRGEAFARFAPLSFRSGTAATVAFAAVAIVPVVAVRIRGRTGSALLIGLGASEAIAVFDALSERFGATYSSVLHITIGWWAHVLAVLLSLLLAQRLRTKQAPQPVSGLLFAWKGSAS